MKTPSLSHTAAAVTLVSLLPLTLQAAPPNPIDRTWKTNANGTWTNVSNWVEGTLPTSVSNAGLLGIITTPTISNSTGSSVSTLYFNTPTALTFNGGLSLYGDYLYRDASGVGDGAINFNTQINFLASASAISNFSDGALNFNSGFRSEGDLAIDGTGTVKIVGLNGSNYSYVNHLSINAGNTIVEAANVVLSTYNRGLDAKQITVGGAGQAATLTLNTSSALIATPGSPVRNGTTKRATDLSIMANGTVTSNGNNQVGSLSGVAGGVLSLSGSTFAVGSNDENTSFSGTITGAGSFLKTGSYQAANLTLTGNNNLSGNFSVQHGSVTLQGANGAISNDIGNIILQGGQLILNNATDIFSNRIADSKKVQLSGGALNVIGKANTAVTETFGVLDVATNGAYMAGGTITLAPGAEGSVVLTGNSLTRTNSGALFIRGDGLGSDSGTYSQLKFNNAPTLIGLSPDSGATKRVIAGAFGSTNSSGRAAGILTYGANGVRLLDSGEYSSTLATNTNVRIASAQSNVTSNLSINSLVMASDNGITIDSTRTLRIYSGSLLSLENTTTTIDGGGLLSIYGSAAAIGRGFLQVEGNLTISAMLYNPTFGYGIDKTGTGTLTLAADNTFVASTKGINGNVTVSEGTLIVAHNKALGSSQAYVANTGRLLIGNGIDEDSASIRLSGGGTLGVAGGSGAQATLTQSLSLSGVGNIDLDAGTRLDINGALSGLLDSVLVKQGDGIVYFNAASNTATAFQIKDGMAIVTNATFLNGNNTTEVSNGGTFALDGGITNAVARPYWLTGSGHEGKGALRALTGNNALTSGTLSLNGNVAIGADETASFTIGSTLSNGYDSDENPTSGGLVKVGKGTVRLTGTNSYTGLTRITEGRLEVNSNLNYTTNGAVQIESGGTLAGTARVGSVRVEQGGIIAPGQSIGKLTAGDTLFEQGGIYQLELNNTVGVAGINWDQYAIVGSLDLSELSDATPFTISLTSLTGTGEAGLVEGWDSTQDYLWAGILTTTTTITSFNEGLFSVNSGGFAGATGNFSVVLGSDGRSLDLQYIAVPEPGSVGLAFITFGGAAAILRLRRQKRSL